MKSSGCPAIAKLCRGKGMHLALLDIDQTNLVKAKNALHELNPSLLTEAYVLDVADIEIAGERRTAIRLTIDDRERRIPEANLLDLSRPIEAFAEALAVD